MGSPEPKEYLGYTDGEMVRDLRTGTVGQVRVRDCEELGRYGEVRWSPMIQEELELAIDNGLERVQERVQER